jgi:hypothetical protein
MNPHIFYSDPLRKLFYSYSGSELQIYIYILAIYFYSLLAKKATNISFCYVLSIYPKRGLGALLKKEEERERERKRSKRKRINVPIKKTLSH